MTFEFWKRWRTALVKH